MNTIAQQGSEAPYPILALHGTASRGRQWNRLVGACGDNRLVLTPDLPGYGTSPTVDRPGLNARLQPLLGQLRHISGPVHLVGHSFGGALALRLAEIHPERVLSVSIYEPTSLGVFAPSCEVGDATLLQQMQTLAARVAAASPMDAMYYFIDFWMGAGQWQALEKSVQESLARYASITAQDFRDGLYEAAVVSQHAPYSGPLQLLCGSQTTSVTKRICKLLSLAMPHAELSCLSGLGHMGPLQDAHRVNAAIMGHIDAVETAMQDTGRLGCLSDLF